MLRRFVLLGSVALLILAAGHFCFYYLLFAEQMVRYGLVFLGPLFVVDERLRELTEGTPHFFALLGPVAVLVAQLLFLYLSSRQRRACRALEDRVRAQGWASIAEARAIPWWPGLLAGASTLAIPALATWALAAGRAEILRLLANPWVRMNQPFLSVNAMYCAVPWAALLFPVCALLAMVSVTMSMVARDRNQRLRALSLSNPSGDREALLLSCRGPGWVELATLPVLLFLGGCLPVLWGAWGYDVRMIRELPGAASYWRDLLEQSRIVFAARAWLAWPGTIAATLVSAVLLTTWTKRGPTKPSAWITATLAVFCLLAAAGFVVAAAPYREEARMPWPSRVGEGNVLAMDEPRSPKLQGPSSVERAPVLWIGQDTLSLDGKVVDLAGLEEGLREHRWSIKLYKCCEDPTLLLIVLAVAETPMSKLTDCLRVALGNYHPHVLFAFTKRETFHRPVFGTVSRVLESGAYATLTTDQNPVVPANAVLVNSKDFATYDQLARRVVELGYARRGVLLGI